MKLAQHVLCTLHTVVNRSKFTRKLMNSRQYPLNSKTRGIATQFFSLLLSTNSFKFGLAVLSLTVATNSIAEWDNNSPAETAYVDSIHGWGAWELDIEPAAGGITPAVAQTLNARSSKVSFRINSIAALAPVPGAATTVPPTTPVPPTVIPLMPPVPPVVPPIGGPADGLF